VGGKLEGLTSAGSLKISLNGTTPLVLSVPGNFRFPVSLLSGTPYAVTIDAQPAGQTCTIASGSGTLTADVNNVAITCVAMPAAAIPTTIKITVEGMAAGRSITLSDQGKAATSFGNNGSFAFAGVEGAPYALAVTRNPDGQWCKITGGAGIATASTTPVTVTCRDAQLALLAGTGGGPGSSDGTSTNARFTRPMGVVVDSSGNLFVADMGNHAIRKVTPSGDVTTFAGAAEQSANIDGVGKDARFGGPTGIAIDAADNLYVTDAVFGNVRKITPTGAVTTLADTATVIGSQSPAAAFHVLTGIARDAAGNLYIADSGNQVIRKRAPNGSVTTFAGKEGVCSHVDGAAGQGTLCTPTGITLDANGNLFVVDASTQVVRKISPDGTLSTVAGTENQPGGRDGPGTYALFGFTGTKDDDYSTPLAGIVVEPSGSLLVTDYYNGRVRRIAPNGDVSTAIGVGEGYIDGPATSARFRQPTGIALGANGQVFIAEDTDAIRVFASGQVSTFAGRPLIGDQFDGVGTAAQFSNPAGLAVDAAGNIYVADYNNSAIRKVTQAGLVTTFAGRPDRNATVEASTAPNQVVNPGGMTIDRAGNLYVTDRSCVRKVTPDGNITILAGSPIEPGYVDGPGSTARFSILKGVTVDDNGNVYVTDSYTLRKITPDGTVSTLVRSGCDNLDGNPGRFCTPNGIVVDHSGNLYFSDSGNMNIRKLTPDGVMTTVAGNTAEFIKNDGSADGQGDAARFSFPGSLALDSAGNLYVADAGNSTVRMITPSGYVSTLVGIPGRYEVHEGPLPALLAYVVLTVGPDDRLYIGSANSVLTVKLR
jgi:sugar lactone lactonase YvrE